MDPLRVYWEEKEGKMFGEKKVVKKSGILLAIKDDSRCVVRMDNGTLESVYDISEIVDSKWEKP